jgi:hypothetical protein
MAENMAKKQHYVPEFYIKGFSDNGKSIYVFDKERGKIYEKNVREVCTKRHIYENPVGDSEVEERFFLPNDIEDRHARLESDFAMMLRRVKREYSLAVLEMKNPALSNQDKELLIRMVANFLTRNKWTLENFNKEHDPEAFEELAPYLELCQMIKLDFYAVAEASRKRIIMTGEHEKYLPNVICENLRQLELSLVKATGGAKFAASSFPIIYLTEDYEDETTYFTWVFLPIDPFLAVMLAAGDSTGEVCIRECEPEDVDKINAVFADPKSDLASYVLSSDRALLERLMVGAEMPSTDES